MCGIAGVVRQSGAIERDPSALLSEALAHRGPDGAGVWHSADGHVALVHRRLAIIDPGPRAAQPMRTPDGRHHIVFNGEVYNYLALRRSLSDRGELFTTGSDTEVLLRLLARDGPDALSRVRGMFALAWWDDRERALLLARDRFGIKPLYVAATADTLAFASEIRALTASGLVQRRIDPAGVMAYLSWGTVPASLTWMEGVESLTPGTWMRRTVDGLTVQRPFADVAAVYARPASGCGEQELKDRVRGAVQDSVAAHLVADVPVGVFLSGGIDSSAILSAAVNAGARGLNTYNVRFDDSSSEHEYAGLVASTFGSTHHELVLDSSRIVDDLPRILRHLDQPTLDAVNSFYVSEAVAKTGIKAVLSGTGGDELFGGYPSFRRLPPAVRSKRRLQPVAPAVGSAVSAVLPQRLTQRWRHFIAGNGGVDNAYRAQRGLYMPLEVEQLAGPALRDRWAPVAARLSAAERVMFDGRAVTVEGDVARLETRVYLGSQLLRDLDAMSMAHSLEVRVPFVDHELLGEVWPDLGQYPGLMRNKRLLHETLVLPLPHAAVNRPKQGFTLPFAKWMSGELEPFVRSGMAFLARSGWIAEGAPDDTWNAWQRGTMHWSRPWALGVLGEFLRQT
jgi:asparagine synthase (glutamine-hydrolysing)